jgi:hypothetical protein
MRHAVVLLACALVGGAALSCQPVATPKPTGDPSSTAAPPRSTSCREDIPDCSAICALRETGRTAYLDFFERRCAAVMQGKNPDKVVTDLQPTPYVATGADGGAVDTAPEPAGTGLTLPASVPPFDPTSVGRTGAGEPPECKASRLLRAQHRDREADVLGALCIAKGGGGNPDGGT